MNTESHLRSVLKNLDKISKNILIIEIQDPNEENILGRIRHKYYMKFLKDEGKCFYIKDKFEKIINDEFPINKPEYEYVSTIRGVYMFAYISGLG
jgi:hypothetical protein